MASDVSLSKLRLTLEKGQTADFLSLNNQSQDSKEAFEINIKKWTQKDNVDGQQKTPTDQLEDSNDFLVSPQTVVILPKQDKTVRLIVSNQSEAVKNYSYRMIINQLPNKEVGQEKASTINLLFQVSIPIFVYNEPIKTIDKMNIAHSIEKNNGKNYLVLKNNDTQHIQISSIDWGKEKQSMNCYILPGVSNKFELPQGTNSDASFEITTDKGKMIIGK